MVRARTQPLAKAELHELAKAGRDVRIETCMPAAPQPEMLRKGPLRTDVQRDAKRPRDRDDKRELSA